jgi:tRNA pseudouridine38/39 synthase
MPARQLILKSSIASRLALQLVTRPSAVPHHSRSLHKSTPALTPRTRPMSNGINGVPATPNITDYKSLSNVELISRITNLESQLRNQTAFLQSLTSPSSSTLLTHPHPLKSKAPTRTKPEKPRSHSRSPPPRKSRPFDPTAYSTRHIALKFAYLGQKYGGYEHANNNITPLPTVEEVLWKALRKARLISPTISEGADQSYEVCWGRKERVERYGTGDGKDGKLRLEINWGGCEYSKCGRTDRGVSAFGQVIGVRVRSNRPIQKKSEVKPVNGHEEADGEGEGDIEDEMPSIDVDDLTTEPHTKPFGSVHDELPYISLLNTLLPPDIRILAWCPSPSPTFDARFSCRERRYKYFFTNPAFCPTPGPAGMMKSDGTGASPRREGWLDIEKMKIAARKLEGLHDFRNLCKIDASKQMSSCVRRITFADVLEWDGAGGLVANQPGLGEDADGGKQNGTTSHFAGPKTYAFCVHGTAFLWHQVRCMVAVLFLVGQGLEEPSIIDELLDVKNNPGRPMYEMADDAPLVLWDCIFPEKDSEVGEDIVDALNWVYAGDEVSLPALSMQVSKNDGKFGIGAVVDELWSQWREAKMQEILTGSLLDLAIGQGDGSLYQRAPDESLAGRVRSQKVFDGSSKARYQGKYVPVTKKPRMETLEIINGKYLKRGNARQIDPIAPDEVTKSRVNSN